MIVIEVKCLFTIYCVPLIHLMNSRELSEHRLRPKSRVFRPRCQTLEVVKRLLTYLQMYSCEVSQGPENGVSYLVRTCVIIYI